LRFKGKGGGLRKKNLHRYDSRGSGYNRRREKGLGEKAKGKSPNERTKKAGRGHLHKHATRMRYAGPGNRGAA